MSNDLQHQLAQMADIHGAAAPQWWPPAPGWWLLAGIVLVGLLVLARRFVLRLADRRRRRAWLAELDALRERHDPAEAPHDYLAALNRLFRAVALRAFPGTACARLEGEEWVAFIAERLPAEAKLEPLAVLARGPYEPAPGFDDSALQHLAAAWVKRHG
jgi:hypothetical protein